MAENNDATTNARDSFRIVIVGGGIAGLAAAIALRDVNRHIIVLERSSMLKETGALISLQPNASKIVTQWGLDPFLEIAEPQTDHGFRLFDTAGRLLREVPLDKAQFGAERRLYHRQDFHLALRNAATSTDMPGKPVEIRSGCAVVACDPEEGLVTIAGGETLGGDVVVGADGIKSIMRAVMLKEQFKAQPTGISAYRVLVPTESIKDVEDAPESVKQHDPAMTSMVMGKDKRVIMGPGRGGKLFGIVALVPDEEMTEKSSDDSWVQPGSKMRLLEAFADFPPWLRRIFESAPEDEIGLWQLRDLDPLPTWTIGRAILIGDAAHAMLPTQGQGASQAFEDAEALQAFFGSFQLRPTKAEVQDALNNVLEARYQRVSLIQEYSRIQVKPPTQKGVISATLDPAQFMRYNCEYNGAVDWLSKQSQVSSMV